MAPTGALRFGTLGLIHIAFDDVCLSPGRGSHRLTLPLKATGTWLSQATDHEPTSTTPALLTGTLWTEQPTFSWLAGVEPQVVSVRGFMAAEELSVNLSGDQLLALERARGEDDLRLVLKFQATLLAGPPGVHPVAAVEQVSLRVPRARWLELLHQVGAAVGIVLQVPSPLTDLPAQAPPSASAEDVASLSQAAARLRQARTELHDHQWEHCVATCRRVLENVGRLVPVPNPKQVASVPPRERSQELRWAAVYHDVLSMASAAHHDDGTTDEFSWTRADAEAILATTAGLLVKYTAL